ncbi:hypothetical protein BR93DRAFT_967479 [Coniochaeta sp. PMI_546]|nr:hypothetical protein BR93DRAFT_967479 [Coniochaeta sp. PMI_546]
MSGQGSSSGSGSKKSKAKKIVWHLVWNCHNCNASGMTVSMNTHCPTCDHGLCSHCKQYYVDAYDM